jgi:hypothetical protein
MIKRNKVIILYIVAFFTLIWVLYSNINVAIQTTVTFFGISFFVYTLIFIYKRLKSNKFRFSGAISRKEWLLSAIAIIVIWTVFLTVLSEISLIFATSVSSILLVGLFIYDIVKTIIAKLF